MSEKTPVNFEKENQNQEEIYNAKRLAFLNLWLDFIEEQNDGKPAAIILSEKMTNTHHKKKTNS